MSLGGRLEESISCRHVLAEGGRRVDVQTCDMQPKIVLMAELLDFAQLIATAE